MRLRHMVAAWAVFAALGTSAQVLIPSDVDWREAEAPPPPPLRTTGLIDIEVKGTTLRFGVDPASVTLGADGIVRYVVVAQNPSGGAVNGIYEGIRCQKAEVRIYARHSPDSGWVKQPDSDWQPLQSGQHARYSLLIARSAACLGQSPNGDAKQIVRDLSAPIDTRFRIETR